MIPHIVMGTSDAQTRLSISQDTHTNKQIILYGEKKNNILPTRENKVENLDALSSDAVA